MKHSYHKVLLVNPGKNQIYAFCEPLNLASMASYLMVHGFDVRIADELIGDNVEEIIDAFQPDLVGITACTPLAYDAYRIAKTARTRKIPTVMGGAHASVMTEEALQHVDMVVQGEGEIALLNILTQGQERGVFVSRETLNLDDCPPPARHLLRMDYYLNVRQRYSQTANYLFVPRHEHVLNLMIGRGCYWKCTFCHNTWRDHPCRYRHASAIVQEMQDLHHTYGVNYLNFMDDNLFGYRRLCHDLFWELIQSKSEIRWGANARVDCVNDEILDLARKAGCRKVNFGFESGSQKVLDILNKHIKVEQIEKAVNLCRKHKMMVIGTFMIGNPGETLDDINKTRELIRRLPLHHVGISLTTPFPGTELWRMCEDKGRIPEHLDWTVFDFDHAPIQVSDTFTIDQLLRLHRELFFDAFIHNPRILWKMLQAFLLNPKQVLLRIRSVALPH